jgi:hypothetical protein
MRFVLNTLELNKAGLKPELSAHSGCPAEHPEQQGNIITTKKNNFNKKSTVQTISIIKMKKSALSFFCCSTCSAGHVEYMINLILNQALQKIPLIISKSKLIVN